MHVYDGVEKVILLGRIFHRFLNSRCKIKNRENANDRSTLTKNAMFDLFWKIQFYDDLKNDSSNDETSRILNNL